MNVLVANDDGIKAEGIRRLIEALATKVDVYLFAPDRQRSAAGHGITVGHNITCTPVQYAGTASAYMVDGTPADCVKLGMNLMHRYGVDIDMVFSGINHGGNLGTDTLYSGTVSAAIEGNLCGAPAAALSVNSHEAKHFTLACELALQVIETSYPKMDNLTTLNINVPNAPKEMVKGVKVTRLGLREYDNWLDEKELDDGIISYRYTGAPVEYSSANTQIDVIAMQQGYATITPLKFDLTAHEKLSAFEETAVAVSQNMNV